MHNNLLLQMRLAFQLAPVHAHQFIAECMPALALQLA